MPFPKYNGIRLAKNSWIENLHVEILAADPILSSAGRLWLNTTEGVIKYSAVLGAGWVARNLTNADTEEDVNQLIRDNLANLETVVSGKAGAATVYTKDEVVSLLTSKADTALVNTKADASAVHTKIEVTNLLSGKADNSALALKADASSVNTAAEVTALLAAKANAANVNTKSEVTSLLELKAEITSQAMGIINGGQLNWINSGTDNLNVTIAAGYGYLMRAGDQSVVRVDWSGVTYTMSPDVSNYLVINENGVISSVVTFPDTRSFIILGRIVTGTTFIKNIDPSNLRARHIGNSLDRFNRLALGPVFVSGCLVSENILTARGVNVTAGHFFFSTNEFYPSAVTGAVMRTFRHSQGLWSRYIESVVNNTHYDDGTNLTPLSPGYFTLHAIHVSSDGVFQNTMMVYGQAQYATLVEAEAGSVPIPPPVFTEGTVPVAVIIVQEGVANFVKVMDIRPRIGFSSKGSSAASSHSNLLSLDSDDHLQYVPRDGARGMLGHLDMGGYNVTNVGTVGGVNVAAHKSRHAPGGADALSTATAAGLNAASTNTEGSAQAFARSDHTHQITGFQPSSTTLASLVALTGQGPARRNTDGTWDMNGLLAQDIPNLPWSRVTSGKPTTLAGYGIVDGAHDDDFRFNNAVIKVVSKSPGKGQYNRIFDALASITDASAEKPYLIKVEPGVYLEPQFNTKFYVRIMGSGQEATYVRPLDPAEHLLIGEVDSGVSHLTLEGVTGTDKALAYLKSLAGSTTRVFRLENVCLGATDTLVLCEGGYTTVTSCTLGGVNVFRRGFIANDSAGVAARIALRNTGTNGMSAPYPVTFAQADGPLAQILITGGMIRASASSVLSGNVGVGIHIRNGARCRGIGSSIVGFATGIWSENAGLAPTLECVGINLGGNMVDLDIDHVGTKGSFQGSAIKSAVNVAPGATSFSLMYTDQAGGGLVNVGALHLGMEHSGASDMAPLIYRGMPSGIMEGGKLSVSVTDPFDVKAEAGSGYVKVGDVSRRVVWPETVLTLGTTSVNYFVYVDSTSIVKFSSSAPDGTTNVILGRCTMSPTGIGNASDLDSSVISNFSPMVERYLKNVLGVVVVSGSIVSANAQTPLALDVTSGYFFQGIVERKPAAALAPVMAVLRATATSLVVQYQNTLINEQYATPTGYVNAPAGHYMKHLLMVDVSYDQTLYIINSATETFELLDDAIASLPSTTLIKDDLGRPRLAEIIVQQGNPNIVQILDVRPKIAKATAAGAGVEAAANHADLVGLETDSHLQYLPLTGARPMTGGLDMGGNAISNITTINGANFSAHAARHGANGADPVPTAIASSLSNTTTNAAGTANTLARSDHTHAVTGFQVYSTQLANVAALVGAGFVRRDGAGAWSASALVTADVPALDWSKITTGKPTTLSGYGITDALLYANAAITAGTGIKVTYDTKGLVTGSAALLEADVPALDWSKITTGTPTTITGYGITVIAADIPNLDWSKIATGKPTTLAGYGITDAGNVQRVTSGNIVATSGTTLIPYDSTPPLNTEGTSVLSVVVTPTLNTNKFVFSFTGPADNSSATIRFITVALFRAIGAGAATLVGSVSKQFTTAAQITPITLLLTDSPATTTAVTYSLRVGTSVAGTWYLGRGSTATMGGSLACGYSITEIR